MEKKTNAGDWSGYVAIQNMETKQYLSGFVIEPLKRGKGGSALVLAMK